MTSLTQRFADLREAARNSLDPSKLDDATLEIAMVICADIVGVDVIDVRASGTGSVVIDIGSGHRIEITPPERTSSPDAA